MKLEDEIKLVQDSVTKYWAMYMTWFSWHFGIQIVAFGGAFSVKALASHLRLVAIYLFVTGIAAVGGSIFMIIYHRRTATHLRALSHGRLRIRR
jgi:hypothetical protein